eukprot:TRINITY_DN9310_c0_g1_i1.p1 TRINITY_DN9310_c0_g1~~TRINITY_DN9310_c0_g1_i1.p1  ORF type:complete len:108 (-),score=8.87 TRINITY_DN9310_c0_g1_i1:32-355(-)
MGRDEQVKRNEFYVRRNTQIQPLLKRIDLVMQERSEVTLHGLGAAVTKTVDIANIVVSRSLGRYTTSVTTSTVPLIDDYSPLSDVILHPLFLCILIFVMMVTNALLV